MPDQRRLAILRNQPGTQGKRRLHWIAIALGLLLGRCGGHPAPSVLFAGSAAALIPHDVGRASYFVVHKRGTDNRSETRLTRRVLAEGPAGHFVVETTTDAGWTQRSRIQVLKDEILLEAIALEEAPGLLWHEIHPPVILARTPVIAGQTSENRFARTIEVNVSVDGESRPRSLLFEGHGSTTPLRKEEILLEGHPASAIFFDIRGQGQLRHPPGEIGVTLGIHFEGILEIVPGVGTVRESLDFTVRVGGEKTHFRVVVERDSRSERNAAALQVPSPNTHATAKSAPGFPPNPKGASNA